MGNLSPWETSSWHLAVLKPMPHRCQKIYKMRARNGPGWRRRDSQARTHPGYEQNGSEKRAPLLAMAPAPTETQIKVIK